MAETPMAARRHYGGRASRAWVLFSLGMASVAFGLFLHDGARSVGDVIFYGALLAAPLGIGAVLILGLRAPRDVPEAVGWALSGWIVASAWLLAL